MLTCTKTLVFQKVSCDTFLIRFHCASRTPLAHLSPLRHYDCRATSGTTIVPLPRNSLASSAAGGASAVSTPCKEYFPPRVSVENTIRFICRPQAANSAGHSLTDSYLYSDFHKGFYIIICSFVVCYPRDRVEVNIAAVVALQSLKALAENVSLRAEADR